MKTFFRFLVAVACVLSVECFGQQWEDIFAVNVGDLAVPPSQDFASGFCLVSMSIGTHACGVGVQGLGPGDEVANYADFGSDKGGNPTISASVTNVIIMGSYAGVDSNGNLAIYVDFKWYNPADQPCFTNQTVYMTDPYSGLANVWVYDSHGHQVDFTTVGVPVSDQAFAFADVPCTNTPYSLMFSNLPSDCITNTTVYLNDTWTNGIVVTVNDVHGVQRYNGEMQGPLNSTPLDFSEVQCTNLPYVAIYSNEPACMTPMVFNVINTAQYWRIFAVVQSGSAGGVGGALGEGLVAPGAQYYYSNTVPCSAVGSYSLWASSGNGDDSIQNTGVTPNSTATNGAALGDDIGNNANPGSGSSTNSPNYGDTGQAPGVTNTPPVAVNPSTNSLPPTLQQTNALLPVVPQVTNGLAITPASTNGIIWANTNTDLTALTTAVQNGQQAIYSAVNTGAGQQHSDLNNVANEIATGINQAHSDANGINNTIANGNTQAATNASAINNTIENGLNQIATNQLAGQQQGVNNANGVINGANTNAAGVIGAINTAAGAGSAATANQTAALSNAVTSAASSAASSVSNAVTGAASGSTTVISNLLTQIVSNTVAGETNYALETTQDKVLTTDVGVSNTLVGISNVLTSGSASSNGMTLGPTNYSAAEALVNAGPMGPVLAGLQGLETDFICPQVPDDSMPPCIVTFPGTALTMDLNPLDSPYFNQIANLALHFFSWLLVMAYIGKVLVDITTFLRWLTDAKPTTVPDLDISGGFLTVNAGGNFGGAVVYPMVIAATLLAWSVAIAAFMAVAWSVAGADLFSTFSAGPLSGAPQGSVLLASHFFPLSLFFSLVTSYLVFRATANFAVMLAVSIVRALPG